ncbi:transmembrane protein 18-like isoform X3 [Acanthaster planci]|uniref:Transmembrane protein 18-like isoform X2 n=1 Tax=Acanthaster planci TaxID=133434 RepID=A0A8B7XRA9_ACAPL|nr:transmembrane protein 18-like isoform X2 [Acanthaster planci]XP_022083380.1 transmembrane protein 18-like isoform X3 [Acanthaster planci]
MAPEQAIGVNDIDGMLAYLEHIEWTESWLITLLLFHATCAVFTVLTRKYFNVQLVYFFLLLILIYFSETINEHAALNYKKFSKHQYFDSNGLFIAVVFSLPLLCNCLLIVMIWVYQTAHLLVKVKRAEVRQRAQEEERKEK